ncbi:MAG TPA: hypothetical protein PK926_13750 [Spirochaetota bacterium]|nr:hypothetical protein [Spirochaetota bacterium]HPI89417.1 hypothetical protein [Spirochaetota bacterium]HPR49627.1 hypothetical protein [Spirochaetota bacterium]
MIIARVLLVMVLSIPLAAPGRAEKKASFKGRVIYCAADVVEVKKGPVEQLFRITPETRVVSTAAGADVRALGLCQMVSVDYEVRDKQKVAVRIEIVKKGDCVANGN